MENNNNNFDSNKTVINKDEKVYNNNNGYSLLNITEGNHLIYQELENKIPDEPNALNVLLSKYLESPKYNTETIKNKKNNLSFSKIFKKRDKSFELELYEYFDIYQTIALYKEGEYSHNISNYKECRLLIKEGYFYILKYFNERTMNILSNNLINPENSFLLRLESDKTINEEDKKYIKYDYELSRPLLCLNLDLLTCKLLINKLHINEFTILILGTNKKYSFIIEEKEIKEKFCYLLGNLIYNSEGYKYNKINLVLQHKYFYSKTYITPEDFEYIAKTGDLLLFKTRHILADIQRTFTCDNYDHIAFVHNNFGFITLFDASKKGSCKGHYWGLFKSSQNSLNFKRVCYRRLNIEEKNIAKKMKIQEKIENDTEQFMKEMNNKKYYLSFCTILCKGRPKNYEITGEWEKAEGYSCSSLVAALYVKLGIIKLNNTVHSIKPGDFEQNKNLYFLPGFSLGPEKIIDFSS